MKKIRIGVIGIGLVGAFHAEAFMRNPSSDLIAICDIDLQRVKNLADNYNCNYYTDYKDLIEKEDLDAISIATPESVRLEPAILSSQKNLKILTSKSMIL